MSPYFNSPFFLSAITTSRQSGHLGLIRSVLAICVLGLVGTCNLGANEPKKQSVDFSRDIRPILAKHCFACHGPDKKEGGFRLVDQESATSQAESGARPIVPGDPAKSELMKRIASQDESQRMPPEGKGLSPREIGLLEQWIQEGAEFKKHWAFLPLERPATPVVEDRDWVRNPIDAFIRKGLEDASLQPVGQASAQVLVRRLYTNITGLPPSIDDVNTFMHSVESHGLDVAYESLVDRLLADPRLGERWARHWLDIVRYAETNSFERDGPKPNAWKYRDYVIRSFNQDKPYSQFLGEQIAGDEIESTNAETLTATGFYRLGIWDDEPADPLQARFDEYDDLVTTIGQSIMGLTLNCARCHDHKIDPISQKDYYSMVAFVRDVTSYGARGNETRNSQIDMTAPQVNDRYDSLRREQESIEKQMREIEQRGIVKMSAEDQRATEGPERGKVLRQRLEANLDAGDWKTWTGHRDRLKEVRDEIKGLPPRVAALGLAHCEARPPVTKVLGRGNPTSEGEEVAPDFPKLFASKTPSITEAPADAKSAGRRKVLAQWLTSEQNFLTARVIVNRVWQHHFGRGLHKSPNNFGQMGEAPTHPELLDWLATELVRQNWNLKPIHRMMLLSNTYRMSSSTIREDGGLNQEALEQDPSNDRFWRFNMRRLSAEEIRDRVLFATGHLNNEKFGPSIFPKLADEVKAGQSVPGKGWDDSNETNASKRSVYIHIKRSLIPPELANFDFPETDSSCEARFLTTQPAQALGMLNGAFMQQQAKKWASRLKESVGGTPERMWDAAIERAWSRPATSEDLESLAQLTAKLKRQHQVSDDDALKFACLVILNANEFVYLD